MFGRVLLVLFAMVLAACAQNAKLESRPNNVSEILSRFQLSFDEGKTETEVPVGVLIAIPPRGSLTFCTAGNVQGTYYTNAHCISDSVSKNPADFYLMYLDKITGEKLTARVQSFGFVGDPSRDDVAVIKTERNLNREWAQFDRPHSKAEAGSEQSYLWAWDPVPSESRGVGAAGINGLGAVFTKKECLVSPQFPRLAKGLVNGNPVDEKTYSLDNKKLDANIHVFIDACATVSGNSGGIITGLASKEARAIFHWHQPKKSFRTFQYYFGNTGVWQAIDGKDFPGPPWSSVVGVATRLDTVNF